MNRREMAFWEIVFSNCAATAFRPDRFAFGSCSGMPDILAGPRDKGNRLERKDS